MLLNSLRKAGPSRAAGEGKTISLSRRVRCGEDALHAAYYMAIRAITNTPHPSSSARRGRLAENNLRSAIFLRGEGKASRHRPLATRRLGKVQRSLKASERLVQVRMAYEFPRDDCRRSPTTHVFQCPRGCLRRRHFSAPRCVYTRQRLYAGGPHRSDRGYTRSAVEEALRGRWTWIKISAAKGALAIACTPASSPRAPCATIAGSHPRPGRG